MRLCILSADDEKGVLDIHYKIMKQYGFEVHRTNRMPAIKEVLKKVDIDCIHLDILFDRDLKEPDWDRPTGLSTVGEIARSNRKIPIMVISGYIDEKAKDMAEKYGLTDLIYKWYSKPADYELVALDTIKAINELKYRYTRDAIVEQIRKEGIKDTELLEKALTKIPTIIHHIELKPRDLLDKIENMCYKMLATFEESDLILFKELIKSHLYDYFCTVSLNHLTLADHLATAVSRSEDENILRKDSIEFILDIIKKFEKDKICDDAIYETKRALEKNFKIHLGIRKGFDVNKYIEKIIGHDSVKGV
jgi:CheY-like chemotaxis protein